MATKRRKNPSGNNALKAPIGARQFLACKPHHFCDFSWLKILSLWFGSLALGSITAFAQPAAQRLFPNLESNIERPLRYRPDGADFVIENGAEFFNRPLYGGNTAFRVDGGDKPEFVLYLPGRGGNLRLAIRQVERVSGAVGLAKTAAPNASASDQRLEGKPLHPAKWLHDAASITTRYRPGSLLYEIRDPLLGPAGVINLTALAYHQTEGLIVRVETIGLPAGLELIWAYGGVNGQRGSRDGDIGTERVPISQWFQLQPEFCKDNAIELGAHSFTLRSKTATITGLVPPDARLSLADATRWNDLPALLENAGSPLVGAPDQARRQAPALQVIIGRASLTNGSPFFLSLQRQAAAGAATEDLSTYKEVGAPADSASKQRLADKPLHPSDLPRLFTETERHFAALRERVLVVTPDPFINAAVGALNVAADAVWDEPQQAIMHGAIAWRTKLLGWRGPYALDALGWHGRARANLTYWAGRQNTDPIPDKLPPPDANANLARSEAALHSNGDMSKSHYDMNLVFIDGLFRHLLWTGDTEFAKKMWPVIERHLAWERRLFRREFGPEKLPLYEAYAAIWASDDLQYSGGGAAHSSAYNYWHNKMAAQIAPLVGADPAPYAKESELIARAMHELLWVNDHFAESKDLLGHQLVHPGAALWTFYHAADCGLGKRMADYICRLPRIPVRGPGVPNDQAYGVLPTTNWMPYSWSLNNVVMGENVHTALALWQANYPEDAFRLLKSSLLASMFMGISPGNVGSMNYLDVYRRESQRDFADGSGVLSRAIIEGLYGLKPDALKGELTVSPHFPAAWAHATLVHPALSLSFLRQGAVDVYTFNAVGKEFTKLNLILPTKRAIRQITIESTDLPGRMRLQPDPGDFLSYAWPVTHSPTKVTIEWGEADGARPPDGLIEPTSANPVPTLQSRPALEDWSPDQPRPVGRPALHDKPDPVDLTARFNDRVTEIFRKDKYLSPRSPFVSLSLPSQGIGYWAGHVNASAEIDDSGLRTLADANGGRITLPNGVPFTTPGPGDAKNILFTSQWDNYPREATVPLTGKARQLHLLMAGSTNAMQSRLDNGEVIVTYTDGTTSRLTLRNPETWWPIEQDYFIDDYQFRLDGPLPIRIDLKTGAVRVLDPVSFKGQGRTIPGGAATVLQLDLDPAKELQSLTVRALANDVVIGLMAATLER